MRGRKYTAFATECFAQVAVERAVEWGGKIDVLSPDSRFAIANMSVEFGGIAGEARAFNY